MNFFILNTFMNLAQNESLEVTVFKNLKPLMKFTILNYNISFEEYARNFYDLLAMVCYPTVLNK